MGWTESTATSHFASPGLRGTAHFPPESAPSLDLSLPVSGKSSAEGELTISLKLGPISYIDTRDQHQMAQPRASAASSAYVQPPALVVPTSLDTAVGLQLSTRFLLDESRHRLDAEFRLQTIQPVQAVSLLVSVEVGEGLPLQAVESTLNHESSAGGIGVRRKAAIHQIGGALLLADLGESGTYQMAKSDRGSLLSYNFFQQSLEKGVILVGRLGLVGPANFLESADEGPQQLQNVAGQWFAEHTYL